MNFNLDNSKSANLRGFLFSIGLIENSIIDLFNSFKKKPANIHNSIILLNNIIKRFY